MRNLLLALLLPLSAVGQIHIDASNPTNRGVTITSMDEIPVASFQAFDFDGQIYCVPSNKVSTPTAPRPWSIDRQELVTDRGGYYLNPARKQGQMACGWLRSGLYCTGDTLSNMVIWAVPDTCDQPSINVTDLGNGNALIEWAAPAPEGVREVVSLKRYLNEDKTGYFGLKTSTLPYTFQVGVSSDPDGVGWLIVETGCELGWNHLNPGRLYPINAPSTLKAPSTGWYIEDRQLKFGN